MRCETCELHRRKRGRRKQHETKSGHGNLDPRNDLLFQGAAINEQA
jgi:hypothetical protein